MERTPDEIKKGLVCMVADLWPNKDCTGCPYWKKVGAYNECNRNEFVPADALALIQQLQTEKAALLFLCEQFGQCVICKYTDKGLNESPCCDCLYGNGDATGSHWQWRGVQKEE